jgi:quercetin dioxygenase-like cupin family protein
VLPRSEPPSVTALGAEIDALLAQERSQHGPAHKVLARQPGLTVGLMALRAGMRLPDHAAPGPLTIHVVRGSVTLRVGEDALALAAGSLVALPARQRHDVEAHQDSALLLTVGETPAGSA